MRSMRGALSGLGSVTDLLLELVRSNLGGERVGLFSICSADRFVLEAGMEQARQGETVVCIESTCNQVNQFGGYTGITPEGFRALVTSVAARTGYPEAGVILGGDHLGPWVWQEEPAASAMAKARDLVRGCVLAGYTKIHLDASMRCADDPGDPGSYLDEEIATERTAQLCRSAEEARSELPEGSPAPVYVIGTEVPVPGGERAGRSEISVTSVGDVERTLALARDVFAREGLHDAWERVIAVVVQPGADFGDAVVFDYDRERACELSAFLGRDGHLVYEAHSTDHQSEAALAAMVADHFAILKVGPWLTFAMREALFALESIERELLAGGGATPSCLREALEEAMVEHPSHWTSYYRGGEAELRLARAFSYSDRSRYYWSRPELREAVERLIGNLSERPIPQTLLSQFLPDQYRAVRQGELSARPDDLIRHKIREVLRLYASACGMG
jgi:D-tagatose-1,6-bisphosphate aldolase subunit GatZ/KbaZ